MFSQFLSCFVCSSDTPTTTYEHGNGIVPRRFVWNCLRVCQRGPGFRQPTCGTSFVANSFRTYNIEATRDPRYEASGKLRYSGLPPPAVAASCPGLSLTRKCDVPRSTESGTAMKRHKRRTDIQRLCLLCFFAALLPVFCPATCHHEPALQQRRAGFSPASAAKRPNSDAPSALGRRDACPTLAAREKLLTPENAPCYRARPWICRPSSCPSSNGTPLVRA